MAALSIYLSLFRGRRKSVSSARTKPYSFNAPLRFLRSSGYDLAHRSYVVSLLLLLLLLLLLVVVVVS